ncbi:MAG TPA: VOC family protein [Geminicoccaceae bacterium]
MNTTDVQLVPHLVVDGAATAIDFYRRAFGAEELYRMPEPGGPRLVHAEISIGGHRVMLCDPFFDARDARALGGTPVTLHLQVPDVDAAFRRAIEAGASEVMAPMDAFWGDRYGRIQDPFGHSWSLATKVREVSEAEMQAALRDMFQT